MKFNFKKYIIIASFALLFGWILALPYEGPVMYGLSEGTDIDATLLNLLSVLLHFIGLFSARTITKNVYSAKRLVLLSLLICFIGSLLIPFIPYTCWYIILPLISCFSGMFVTTYAHFIKKDIPVKDRTHAVADMLIYSNITLVGAHIITNNISAQAGFIFVEVLLVITFFLILKMDYNKETTHHHVFIDHKNLYATYIVLCLFIFIITINSGIMFQVIYPYFGDYELLTSIYTNIPYIVALFALSRMYKKVNKSYMLFVGLAFWGCTFILFSLMAKSIGSFFMIFTLMLGACGIFDLFWWSIMGNLFEYTENPSSIFGLGLSMNVLGVWTGGILGNYLINLGTSKETLSYIGFFIIILSMLILIPLNNKLAILLKDHEFILKIATMNDEVKDKLRFKADNLLTKREKEILEYLLKGYTNTYICEKLYISMNTLKTHNRNIYKKLEVKNKGELIDIWETY